MSRTVDNYQKSQRARQKLVDGAAAYWGRVRERDILKVITDTCDQGRVDYFRNYPNKIVSLKTGEKILAPVPEHQRGKPDITVWCKNGRTLSIETKASNGKLSADQLRWKEVLITKGHEYHAPRTVEEAHTVSRRILELGR